LATPQTPTELLKDLAIETLKIRTNHPCEKIPQSERERVTNELLSIAERLVSKYGLSIPEARRVIAELSSVSV